MFNFFTEHSFAIFVVRAIIPEAILTILTSVNVKYNLGSTYVSVFSCMYVWLSLIHIYLIDFQSQPDRDFKFVMVYQDHLTKFVVLRALKTKTSEEVAYNLVDIFMLFGAPSILQSDNGREFSNKIVNNLKEYWPSLKIVHGKPCHSQSQGSVERANQDIENMIATWMQDEKTDQWSEGLRFVQLMKNRALHSGIKRSPYEALFGCKVKVGLTTSSIPHDMLDTCLLYTSRCV